MLSLSDVVVAVIALCLLEEPKMESMLVNETRKHSPGQSW